VVRRWGGGGEELKGGVEVYGGYCI
jgi:hypothetical protein